MTASKKIVAAALTAGGLLVGGGIAGALDLPDQPDTSVAEEKVADIEAPPADPQAKAAEHRQNESAGDDEDTATEDVTAEAETEDEGEGEGERPTDTHGYEVSQLATTTESEGRDKGEEISTLAKTNGGGNSADAGSQKPADAGSNKP